MKLQLKKKKAIVLIRRYKIFSLYSFVSRADVNWSPFVVCQGRTIKGPQRLLGRRGGPLHDGSSVWAAHGAPGPGGARRGEGGGEMDRVGVGTRAPSIGGVPTHTSPLTTVMAGLAREPREASGIRLGHSRARRATEPILTLPWLT